MTEVFKFYKETNSRPWGHRVYEVSDQGNVKLNGELVEFNDSKPGYYIIGPVVVHRAVAELFIPNPENKPCVDHIDTNTHNNNKNNLRWCTVKENCNNPLTLKHKSESQKIAQRDPETKQRHKKSMKGKNSGKTNGMYGKHHTDEAKKKQSACKKDKHPTEETRNKMSESQKIAQSNSETKQKHQEAAKDRIWINKDGAQKWVKKDQLNLFLNKGWNTGRK